MQRMGPIGVGIEHGAQAGVEVVALFTAHVGIGLIQLPGSVGHYIH